MSSLRNSLHRRNHKERSQLANREKLGSLEKHKDYVLRARDYHSKQQRLQQLRERAASRNKDEFYFGMNKERTMVRSAASLLYHGMLYLVQGGVHVQTRGNKALPVDIVKALKTQDENYLRTKRSRDLKVGIYSYSVLSLTQCHSEN
jgi:U3 small nucleolar RNA-associated protein 11